MEKLKGAWKSLTIWFNGVVLAIVPMIDTVKENLPALGQYMTPENLKVVGLAVLVLNIVLRFKTNRSLAEK